MNGIPNKLRDANSSLEIQLDLDKFGLFYPRLSQPLPRLEAYLSQLLKDTPALLDFSKWGHLLPENYQVALLKQKYYDFEGAYAFWGSVEWVGSIV
jgi:ATP-dependent Lhr-like helicase